MRLSDARWIKIAAAARDLSGNGPVRAFGALCHRMAGAPQRSWSVASRGVVIEQQQIVTTLETSAEIMSNTALEEQIDGQPQEVEDAVVAINDQARDRSLQVALLIPLLATLLGLANSFRMMKLPDVTPSTDLDGMTLGG